MKLKSRMSVAMAGLFGALLLGGGAVVSPALADYGHHSRGCNNGTLNGSFGFYRTGNTPDGALAALGLIVFDGRGNFTGSQNISRGGEYDFDIPIAGQYAIAQDCTGIGYTPAGVEFFRLVVVDGGSGYYIFSESPGNGVYGVGRKTGFPSD